mmetsp:Transcript_12624/g.21023  ORF Transcript_12624/g.21023 Transcript_12624/m.21023 type:complete len:81 (-) Transcript_12624:111-353(-)
MLHSNEETPRKRHSIIRTKHIDAIILDEQDRQWDSDIVPTDWDEIARISVESSLASCTDALHVTLGVSDAEAALNVLLAG